MPPPTSFDLPALLQQFPADAETLLLDVYLADRASASTRLFRIYRPAPAHFHRDSDEQLLCLSGRGRTWVGDPAHGTDFAPGTLLCFERGVIHATPKLYEHPVIFLAIDTPRRDPADITFVDPSLGGAGNFIRQI